MALIAPNQNFPLPNSIGQIIQKRNHGATFKPLKEGIWVVEGRTLFVFEGWLKRLLPAPWDQGLFNLISSLAWGPHMLKYEKVLIVTDEPLKNIEIPLPVDLNAFIEELGKKFQMTQTEVILGILRQSFNEIVS